MHKMNELVKEKNESKINKTLTKDTYCIPKKNVKRTYLKKKQTNKSKIKDKILSICIWKNEYIIPLYPEKITV